MEPKELPDPEGDVRKTIDTTQMIDMLQKAAMKINTNKANRLLLMNAAYTIHQLVTRLSQYETPDNKVM